MVRRKEGVTEPGLAAVWDEGRCGGRLSGTEEGVGGRRGGYSVIFCCIKRRKARRKASSGIGGGRRGSSDCGGGLGFGGERRGWGGCCLEEVDKKWKEERVGVIVL
ncbi:unnamed protein product [Linum trigynum]|uniref:Uncharacterized protein n=1 Tax=Linum trigynum TaxID=586398 RepID=A0AAV2D732_9ROSI